MFNTRVYFVVFAIGRLVVVHVFIGVLGRVLREEIRRGGSVDREEESGNVNFIFVD